MSDQQDSEDGVPPQAREAIMRLIAEIDALKTEIEANNARIAELENLADSDPLTPVVNRRALAREIDRIRAYAARYGGETTLIYLDIDGLKAINDAHGHAAGDAVLRAVAAVLVENVRSSDLVGRLGGDEFGIVLAQAGVDAAAEKVRTLSAMISALRIAEAGDNTPLSASFGIAAILPDSDPDQVLRQADAAMYAEKRKKQVRG